MSHIIPRSREKCGQRLAQDFHQGGVGTWDKGNLDLKSKCRKSFISYSFSYIWIPNLNLGCYSLWVLGDLLRKTISPSKASYILDHIAPYYFKLFKFRFKLLLHAYLNSSNSNPGFNLVVIPDSFVQPILIIELITLCHHSKS